MLSVRRRIILPSLGLAVQIGGGRISRAVSSHAEGATWERLQDQNRVIDSLLRTKVARSPASYLSLPHAFEAPDLLSSPRLSGLVTPIDSRVLAPFYSGIDHNNKRLTFFKTGNEPNRKSSYYVRAFMNEWPRLRLKQDAHAEGWEELAEVFANGFARIGITEFRDFYTHVLPPTVGRLNPHKDRLQDDTWKVDVRFSPTPTELLVLDEVDGRWYALRFAPGGSGFVIDSTLLSHFHAVRAGPSIQQSVLAVFNKQRTSREQMHQALVQMTAGLPLTVDRLDNSSFPDFELPVAPTPHPAPAEAARVHDQMIHHRNHCLTLLRGAIQALHHPISGRLSRVPSSIVGQAIAALPLEVQHEARRLYERACKLPHLARSGFYSPDSPKLMRSLLKAGENSWKVVDRRLISIHGTASVGCHTFRFREYDGTVNTRLRFAWTGSGNIYRFSVSAESANDNSKNLALLARQCNLSVSSSSNFPVYINIHGDAISGKTATVLREHGLSIHVVRTADEPDHGTTRLREIDRLPMRIPRKRPPGFPCTPLSSWQFFLKTRFKLAKKAFDELSPLELKAYNERAQADLRRHGVELSAWRSANPNYRELPKRPRGPRSARNCFTEDSLTSNDGTRQSSRSLTKQFRQLTPQQKQVFEAKAARDKQRYLEDWRQFQMQLTSWRTANPNCKRLPKRPASSWVFFSQDYLRAAKKLFDESTSLEKQEYNDEAKADQLRYQNQLSAWRSANRQAPSAYQLFCSERGPLLLQQHPDKYNGTMGQSSLRRDLKSQWRLLGSVGWVKYDQKAQQPSTNEPPLANVASHTVTSGQVSRRCDWTGCNHVFNTSVAFRRHYLTHIRPFRCDECGFTFTQAGSLKRHAQSHSGERPYTCGCCGDRFTRKTSLVRHSASCP